MDTDKEDDYAAVPCHFQWFETCWLTYESGSVWNQDVFDMNEFFILSEKFVWALWRNVGETGQKVYENEVSRFKIGRKFALFLKKKCKPLAFRLQMY